ncbi:NAD(P)-binding protein [Trametes coccinea BRFM310]|uniref:NAD(P)-binding protein n=1 Tax=Trametes coccinea (strain BRFM310) TaxID=1353009 RepID=A0A1Y2ICZ4_TRAC3|nr:NAD(P)-binding protein [Trametes coccinea BRFM310]
MSNSKVSILLTGATGYIGGSILQALLRHRDAKRFEISTLVRDPSKAKILEEKFGVKTVVGSFADEDKLSALAENAHIIIHTADSADNVEALTAILRGMKARHEKTGDIPHLIHTSGAGVFIQEAREDGSSVQKYSDGDAAQINALPPTAFHRNVELLVIDADETGKYARTHIVTPTFVYGLGHGPLFDAGVANPLTMAVGFFVRAALKRGTVGIKNGGRGIWQNVHIDDLVNLYIGMLDAILSDPEKVSHGREGYFIAENGSSTIGEVAQSIAEGLFALGRVSTSGLVPYAPGEAAQYFGGESFSNLLLSDARCEGVRARREFGWAPKHTTQELLEGLKSEVKEYVKSAE